MGPRDSDKTPTLRKRPGTPWAPREPDRPQIRGESGTKRKYGANSHGDPSDEDDLHDKNGKPVTRRPKREEKPDNWLPQRPPVAYTNKSQWKYGYYQPADNLGQQQPITYQDAYRQYQQRQPKTSASAPHRNVGFGRSDLGSTDFTSQRAPIEPKTTGLEQFPRFGAPGLAPPNLKPMATTGIDSVYRSDRRDPQNFQPRGAPGYSSNLPTMGHSKQPGTNPNSSDQLAGSQRMSYIPKQATGNAFSGQQTIKPSKEWQKGKDYSSGGQRNASYFSHQRAAEVPTAQPRKDNSYGQWMMNPSSDQLNKNFAGSSQRGESYRQVQPQLGPDGWQPSRITPRALPPQVSQDAQQIYQGPQRSEPESSRTARYHREPMVQLHGKLIPKKEIIQGTRQCLAVGTTREDIELDPERFEQWFGPFEVANVAPATVYPVPGPCGDGSHPADTGEPHPHWYDEGSEISEDGRCIPGRCFKLPHRQREKGAHGSYWDPNKVRELVRCEEGWCFPLIRRTPHAEGTRMWHPCWCKCGRKIYNDHCMEDHCFPEMWVFVDEVVPVEDRMEDVSDGVPEVPESDNDMTSGDN